MSDAAVGPDTHPKGGAPASSAVVSEGKRGEAVVRRLMTDIIRPGLPVGANLGSEAALSERYGVSRDVFREAVRLLEHHGIARARRGPGGGVLVTRADTSAIADAFALHLGQRRADLRDLVEVRAAIEVKAAGLAAERLSDDELQWLRRVGACERRSSLHRRRPLPELIAGLASNPLLEVVIDMLGRLARLFGSSTTVSAGTVPAELVAARSLVIDAIVGGDSDGARRAMASYVECESQTNRSVMLTDPHVDRLFARVGTPPRLGATVASEVLAAVIDAEWEEGHRLGSESELMDRFGVSRGPLREAIRLLEHLEIATMRRGPSGGLQITAPSARPVQFAVAVHHAIVPVSPDHIGEVRVVIEDMVVRRLMEEMQPTELIDLVERMGATERVALDDGSAAAERDVHLELSEASGSAVLHLLMVSLMEIHRRRPVNQAPLRDVADLNREHREIAAALLARDGVLAAHRLRRHLAAPW